MTATLTTLVSFNDADGKNPLASLIADANGDLFGTTGAGGGSLAFGTVFEINKTATGYTSTPTTLVSFNNADGDAPLGLDRRFPRRPVRHNLGRRLRHKLGGQLRHGV